MKKIIGILLILTSIFTVSCKSGDNKTKRIKDKTNTTLEQDIEKITPLPKSGVWEVKNYLNDSYYPTLKAKVETYEFSINAHGGRTFYIEIYEKNGLPVVSEDNLIVDTEITSRDQEPLKLIATYVDEHYTGFWTAKYNNKKAFAIVKYLLAANSEVTFNFTGVDRKHPEKPLQKSITIPIEGFKETLKAWTEDLTSDGDVYYGINLPIENH